MYFTQQSKLKDRQAHATEFFGQLGRPQFAFSDELSNLFQCVDGGKPAFGEYQIFEWDDVGGDNLMSRLQMAFKFVGNGEIHGQPFRWLA